MAMYLSHIFPLAETNKFYDCDDLEDSIFFIRRQGKRQKNIFLKNPIDSSTGIHTLNRPKSKKGSSCSIASTATLTRLPSVVPAPSARNAVSLATRQRRRTSEACAAAGRRGCRGPWMPWQRRGARRSARRSRGSPRSRPRGCCRRGGPRRN
jgi:hypothetical protein